MQVNPLSHRGARIHFSVGGRGEKHLYLDALRVGVVTSPGLTLEVLRALHDWCRARILLGLDAQGEGTWVSLGDPPVATPNVPRPAAPAHNRPRRVQPVTHVDRNRGWVGAGMPTTPRAAAKVAPKASPKVAPKPQPKHAPKPQAKPAKPPARPPAPKTYP